MIIDDISFHDSQILKVIENPDGQILEFIIDFPTDWENNIFEHKILKFEGVTHYNVDGIPFSGLPIIFNIENLGEAKNFSTDTRHKIKIDTNSGDRIIEFSKCS